MSNNSNPDGGPAFPSLEEHGLNNACYGLTIRDYFAANISTRDLMTVEFQPDRETLAGRKQPLCYPEGIDSIRFCMEVEAAIRGIYADAMLAERAK